MSPAASLTPANPSLQVARRALSEACAELGMDVAWLGELAGDVVVPRVVVGDGPAFGLTEGEGVPIELTPCGIVIASDRPCWMPALEGYAGVGPTSVRRCT